jgi:hypothetical protein
MKGRLRRNGKEVGRIGMKEGHGMQDNKDSTECGMMELSRKEWKALKGGMDSQEPKG